MKTLRPLFGRETPGLDLSAAAVTREMDATTAAWDALLSTLGDQGNQGDHASPRAVAHLIVRAGRPSTDPYYDSIATVLIELALAHLHSRRAAPDDGDDDAAADASAASGGVRALRAAPGDGAPVRVADLRRFFFDAPAEQLIATLQHSAVAAVRATGAGLLETLRTHDRLRASAFIEAAARVNALAYTPPPTVDRVRV
jgi:hypothetical protein